MDTDSIFDVLVFVRWLHFGTMFVLFGSSFLVLCAPGVAAEMPVPRFGLYLRIAAAGALATGAAWLAATIVNMTGSLAGLVDVQTLHAFFLETVFGPIELARLLLLVLVVTLVFAPMRDRTRAIAITLASGALLVSQAWLGHAAQGGETLVGAVMVAAYAVHVLAGAAWLGGLPPLLAWIVALRRNAAAPALVLQILSSYSLMATLAVGLILASGIANAAFRVAGHIGALWSTPYGAVLLVKIALVGVMLAFATFNRFVAIPRLRGPADSRSSAIGRLYVSIACEMLVGALVLAAAAVLGITPPPVT